MEHKMVDFNFNWVECTMNTETIKNENSMTIPKFGTNTMYRTMLDRVGQKRMTGRLLRAWLTEMMRGRERRAAILSSLLRDLTVADRQRDDSRVGTERLDTPDSIYWDGEEGESKKEKRKIRGENESAWYNREEDMEEQGDWFCSKTTEEAE